MRMRLFATAAAAVALTFAAGTAGANVLGHVVTATFEEYAFAVNPGETLITSFEGGPGLGATDFYAAGFSLAGTGQLYNAWDGGGARPAYGPGIADHDPTQYLSILGGQFVVLTTPNIREISFYVGSIDGYNHLHFNYLVGSPDDADGGWVGDHTIADVGGNQYNGSTNGRLTLTFDQDVTSIRLSSDTNSFEISNIGAVVPEPATWSMMIMGFGAVGALIRRRRQATAFA